MRIYIAKSKAGHYTVTLKSGGMVLERVTHLPSLEQARATGKELKMRLARLRVGGE